MFRGARVTRVGRGRAPAAEALVLFPGFPGHPLPPGALSGPPKMRVEIAKALVRELALDAYMPGYPGLETPGGFSFQCALASGIELCRQLSRRYRRIHAAGHSWGAFVAINAHRALGDGAGRLVLLSGLLELRHEEDVRKFLPYYLANFPQVFGPAERAFARAFADLDAARRSGSPSAPAERMSAETLLIVHGRRDAEIPADSSRRFHARAGGRYVELDADHGYTRALPLLSAVVRSFFSGG